MRGSAAHQGLIADDRAGADLGAGEHDRAAADLDLRAEDQPAGLALRGGAGRQTRVLAEHRVIFDHAAGADDGAGVHDDVGPEGHVGCDLDALPHHQPRPARVGSQFSRSTHRRQSMPPHGSPPAAAASVGAHPAGTAPELGAAPPDRGAGVVDLPQRLRHGLRRARERTRGEGARTGAGARRRAGARSRPPRAPASPGAAEPSSPTSSGEGADAAGGDGQRDRLPSPRRPPCRRSRPSARARAPASRRPATGRAAHVADVTQGGGPPHRGRAP